MATPKPRKEGQTGGWLGHKHNEAASRARGGSPKAKKKKKSWLSCGIIGPAVILTPVFTAAWYLI